MSDGDSAAKSFEDHSDKEQEDLEDPEVPLRDDDEGGHDKEAADQGPEEGVDVEDAGYGDDNYGGEEGGENNDERGEGEDPDEVPEEEQKIGEIMYDKNLEEDDNVFDYDDDENEDARKKKKRSKSDKSKKKKKVKRETADEAEEDSHAEDIDEMDRKPKKGRKKGKREEEVNEEEVDTLIDDMENAYAEDLMCFRNKQPALNKLKLLPKVEAYLKRGGYQKAFIDLRVNGLDVLAKWLTKLPNGAPPSLQLKKKLVDIIYQLPVTDEHLKNSDIGKVIYGMKNNPNEDPDLKKTLKDIVDKWTRMITDMANDYVTNTEDIRERKKIDISLDEYRQRSMSSLKKSIPRLTTKRSGFDFVRKPTVEGNAMRRAQNARQQANEECDKIIKDMKRRMKKELK